MPIFGQKWPFFEKFFFQKNNLSKRLKIKGNSLKCHFHFNLGLFRAFFGQKIRCQKFGKSKANPLQKCQFLAKNGHFLIIFFHKQKSQNELN